MTAPWRSLTGVALVLLLVVCAAGAAPAPGGTVTIGLDQEPPTLDPHATPSAVTYQITANLAESLLYENQDGRILPWLATGFQVSADGKSFTFSLRNDVTFSDGAPLDGAAVKWNFDRIVDPHFAAGASLTNLTGYAGTTVVDDHTVRVNFKAPFAPFLTYAAGSWLPLLSPKTTPEQGPAVNTQPIGSGPFVISEWVRQDHIAMERNPRYARRAPWSSHQGPPYLDRVVWKIVPEAGARAATINSGETQMITLLGAPASVLPSLQADKALRVESLPYPGSSDMLFLNARVAPTDDLQVRRAISYAVNRPAYAETIVKGLGTPACGPLSRHTLDDPSLCATHLYDPQKAAQLLDEDGWRMGPNGIRQKNGTSLTIVINTINYGGGIAPEIELLQGQLLSVGIDARVKGQARPPYYEDNYRCATNATTIFLRSTDWDGLYALFSSSAIGGNFNWACYSNAEVDRLLAQGREELVPARRRATYVTLERLLLDQAVAVPLYDVLSVWAIRNTVRDTKYTYATYPVLNDVYIQK